VLEDCADSWKMLNDQFGPVAGQFTLMSKERTAAFCGLAEKGVTLAPVRVIEDGPVRSVVEAIFSKCSDDGNIYE